MAHPQVGLQVPAGVLLPVDVDEIQCLGNDIAPVSGNAILVHCSHCATVPLITMESAAGPGMVAPRRWRVRTHGSRCRPSPRFQRAKFSIGVSG